ncbi:MAG: Gfo/Idh/MocA family oxidoreductase [Tatlockia sp.]|nr:Gfo/Idh/MocA family oxidoreductase [Tatlockia sp.]
MKLKLALLGCGSISKAHWAGIIERAPEIEVTTLIDINLSNAEELAKLMNKNPDIFSSFEDALIKGDFDAVDIMLPHHLHEEAAIVAFKAGKHVLLEKPIAPTLAACSRIFAAAKKAAEKNNTVFMVGENAQYWPEIREVKRLIDSGAIGEIQTAMANFIFPFDETVRQMMVNQWRSRLAQMGGGIVIDGGSHWLRPLRMWMGEIHSVAAATQPSRKELEGESLCHAILRFQSGKIAYFGANMVSSHTALQPWWKITGDKGEIWIESGFQGRLLLVNADYPDPAGKQIMEPQGYFASFGYQLHDFSQAILHEKPLDANPESALMDLETIHTLYRAAKTQRWEQTAPLSTEGLMDNSLFATAQKINQKSIKEQESVALVGCAKL